MQAMECRIVPIITEYDPCQVAFPDSPPHLCLGWTDRKTPLPASCDSRDDTTFRVIVLRGPNPNLTRVA